MAVGLGLTVLASVAAAHGLQIEKTVEADAVIVFVSFDDGTRPADATVVFTGADGSELLRSPTASDGTTSIDRKLTLGGVVIEIFEPDGHSGYRVLTPGDIGSEK